MRTFARCLQFIGLYYKFAVEAGLLAGHFGRQTQRTGVDGTEVTIIIVESRSVSGVWCVVWSSPRNQSLVSRARAAHQKPNENNSFVQDEHGLDPDEFVGLLIVCDRQPPRRVLIIFPVCSQRLCGRVLLLKLIYDIFPFKLFTSEVASTQPCFKS